MRVGKRENETGQSGTTKKSGPTGASEHPSSEGPVRWHVFRTNLGRTYVASTDRGVCRLTWRARSANDFTAELRRRFPGRSVVRDPQGFAEIERRLRSYLAGDVKNFDLPVDLADRTEFERQVLGAARRIPPGRPIAYSELARRIGRPGAARAVGNALRGNPVPLLVPCHRVVRADGSPGGYGGPDGSSEKVRLLRLESGDQ
jgi:O-6-methylguanine DNA methyltransferase